jgi:NAD(P)-dependent dehydrogenase (short-subunit alcohol dehydrogenase family)
MSSDQSKISEIKENIKSEISSIIGKNANKDDKTTTNEIKKDPILSSKEEAVSLPTYSEQESKKPSSVSAQKQDEHPGKEHAMIEKPQYMALWYKGTGKLKDKVAIITGADSGIGRSVAILYAREGAKVVIAYLNEDIDANETRILVEKEGSEAYLFRGDLKLKKNCLSLIDKTISHYGKIDIIVNNAGEQHATYNIEEISDDDFMNTWYTKFFSMFWIIQYSLKYLKQGSCIINTSSVTAYKGKDTLVDYSATNGAIVAFTRSLALQLSSRGIRVNSVAPGPIWTPLIPSSFGKDLSESKVKEFGKNTPLQRPGQPEEVAPSFVFLASQDSSYYTGQVLHPNGGEIVNS